MLGDKFRLRFEKAGVLRLLSHHDLMRVLERMLRRAGLPFKSTAGFHPMPRIVFAQSLPLGVAGRDEVVELELTEPRDADAVLAEVNAQAPAGLRFTRVAVVPMKVTAIPRRIVYTLPLPADRVSQASEAAAALMGSEAVWVERVRPSPKGLNIRPYLRAVRVGGSPERPNPPAPFPKREGGDAPTDWPAPVGADPAPGSASACSPSPPRGGAGSAEGGTRGEVGHASPAGGGGSPEPPNPPGPPSLGGKGGDAPTDSTGAVVRDPAPGSDYARSPSPPRGGAGSANGGTRGEVDHLTLDLWVTNTGTARADELLRLLGVDDLLDAGFVLERTLVELRDEAAPAADPTDNPPDGPADTRPADPAHAARAGLDQPAAPTGVAVPGDLAAE